MEELLAKVVPLALGAAVSPMVLTVQIFILAGRVKPLLRAWVFTAGGALTLVAYSVLGATILKGGGAERHSVSTAIIRLVAAALLLLLAIRAARAKTTSSQKLLDRLDSASTLSFLIVGVLTMIANFSTLVLFLPAIHEILRSSVSEADKFLTYALLLAITMIPALLPVGIATLMGSRADGILEGLHRFVTKHTKQINVGPTPYTSDRFIWAAATAVRISGSCGSTPTSNTRCQKVSSVVGSRRANSLTPRFPTNRTCCWTSRDCMMRSLTTCGRTPAS